VRIGVVSRFAPNVTYTGYQPIMDYLNRAGTRHYELQLSTSYQDAVDRLREGRVDASFLGAWIYGHLAPDEDLPPIAAPLNAEGSSHFKAVLVARASSDLTAVSQLRGLRVALPSRQSWSGNWLQTNGLKDAGLTVADLDSVHHFDHHQTVVWQVLRRNFDAGVVKESVAAEYASEGLRTVAFSQPIPGPPLVGRPGMDSEVLTEISRLLLRLDPHRPEDKAVLESWTPEFSFGFTAVGRGQYRSAFQGEAPK
jgi:phosphonate transport system substrate-binding protein